MPKRRRSEDPSKGKRYQRKAPLTPSKLRSAISNGRRLLHGVNHCSAEMRRLADCVNDHIAQLGGEDNVSHAERVLISRTSMMTVLAEMQERDFVKGKFRIEPDDVIAYLRLINTLRRTFTSLGLQRRAKDVTPSLSEYLRNHQNNNDDVEDAVIVED